MLEEESQKWCLKSLRLNLAQKMQIYEAKTNVRWREMQWGGAPGWVNLTPIGSLIKRVLLKVVWGIAAAGW